jgi:hypothetical protein
MAKTTVHILESGGGGAAVLRLEFYAGIHYRLEDTSYFLIIFSPYRITSCPTSLRKIERGPVRLSYHDVQYNF